MNRRVRALRAAARRAGYRLHYDSVGGTYSCVTRAAARVGVRFGAVLPNHEPRGDILDVVTELLQRAVKRAGGHRDHRRDGTVLARRWHATAVSRFWPLWSLCRAPVP